MRVAVTFLLLFVLGSVAHARVLRTPIWGARPLGMGNAFLAVADDANAVFYNPAALAKVKGVHWNIVDLSLGADSMDTVNRMKHAIFDGDYRGLVRTDTPQFIHVGGKTSLVVPYFALSFYDGFQGFFDVGNLTSLDAYIDIFSVNDVGAVAAFGFPAGDNVSVGFSVKGLQRSGVDVDITGRDLLERSGATVSDFLTGAYDYVQGMAGLGWGIGLNAGVLVDVPLKTKSPKLRLAATAEDMGRTTFRAIGNNPTPAPILPSYHFGASLKYELSKSTDLNIASDLRNNFESMPLVKSFNFGLELRHRVAAVRAGFHQGYITYGASLEFPPHTRIHFASYSVELGNQFQERGNRWYLLQFIVGFNPF